MTLIPVSGRLGPSEAWLPIPDWPEYDVSDCGRVRRSAPGKGTQAGRVHAQCRDRGGRVVVNLSRGGVRRQFKVHRLVLRAFVGPCPDGMEVAHLNGNPADNRLVNLKYATHAENNSHKVIHGTQWRGEDAPGAKLSDAQVRWIRENRGLVSYSRMAAKLGVHLQTVAAVAQGKHWRHVS